jgi:hypothetical protein
MQLWHSSTLLPSGGPGPHEVEQIGHWVYRSKTTLLKKSWFSREVCLHLQLRFKTPRLYGQSKIHHWDCIYRLSKHFMGLLRQHLGTSLSSLRTSRTLIIRWALYRPDPNTSLLVLQQSHSSPGCRSRPWTSQSNISGRTPSTFQLHPDFLLFQHQWPL